MKQIYITLLILISLPVNAANFQPLPMQFSEFYLGMSLGEFEKITGVTKSEPCHHCSKNEKFYSIGAPKPDDIFQFQEYAEFIFINNKLYFIAIGLYGSKIELYASLKSKYGPAIKIDGNNMIWESKDIHFTIRSNKNDIVSSVLTYSKKINK